MKNLIVFFILLLCTVNLFATTRFWDGGAGTLNWFDAANWSGNTLPNVNCNTIFDGDGNSGNNSAGTVPLCIDLGGATITLDRLFLRDGVDITFKNGTIKINSISNTLGLSVAGGSRLTTQSADLNVCGRVAVVSSSFLNIGCDDNLNITFPTNISPDEGVTALAISGPTDKGTLTNCGNIFVGSGFLQGILVEGCADNTGKIEIDNGTYPGRKGCGLCIGDVGDPLAAPSAIFTNKGTINVRVGFAIGTIVRAGASLMNMGSCSVLSTTSGDGNGSGLILQGNDLGVPDPMHTFFGSFSNDGLLIRNNNGPICTDGGSGIPPAIFEICVDNPGQTATYCINGVNNTTATLDEIVNIRSGVNNISDPANKTIYCKTIMITDPLVDQILDVKSIAGCTDLCEATSRIELAQSIGVGIDKHIDDFIRLLDCGESFDTNCVFTGIPHGGFFTYWETAAAAADDDPFTNFAGEQVGGNPFRNIKDDVIVHARYEINGGCIATDFISIVVESLTIVLETQNLTICDGQSVNLTTGVTSFDNGGSTGGINTAFFASNQEAIDSMNPLPSTLVNTAGTYYARYDVDIDFDDRCDGCVQIQPIEVTVNPLPDCSITGNMAPIANTTGEIYSGPAGMASYAWSVTGATINGSSTGQNATIDFGTSASTIQLTVTDANGCITICSKVINLTTCTLTCNISGNSSNVENTLGVVYTGPTGMTSYAWQITAGDASINGITTGQNATIDFGTSTSTIQLTVTDAAGCVAICEFPVNVTAIIMIPPIYTWSFLDPCNCDNLNNITLVDGTFLVADFIRVDASQYTNPTVTLAAADVNFLDNTGTTINAATATFTNEGAGIFILPFYVRSNEPASFTIDVDGDQQSGASSADCSCNIAIPTMSQWGLLIFGLLVLNMGILFLYRIDIQLI